ncbi:MAG: hypothetical protein WB762_03685 [Candidatus Sulfotelmatobacter sp.]
MWRPQSLASLTALPLHANRSVVLGGALLLAVLFAANGIHIILVGKMGPRFIKLPQPGKVLPYPSRFALAALYFAVATGLALLVWQLVMA